MAGDLVVTKCAKKGILEGKINGIKQIAGFF
jgi:hypothetical protein